MKYIAFFLFVFTGGCNSYQPKQSLSLTDLNQSSTWFELPQYYDGVPKYSGSFGTYTAKHTPIAIKHNGVTYYTYSDNSDGVLKIYVSNETETIEVHQSPLDDPHSNATISVDRFGHIMIYVSARGDKITGSTYRSLERESLSGFQLIDNTWMAYPQPWNTKQGQIILYTLYQRPFGGKKVRQLYVKTPTCNKHLVKGGHYQVSTFDGSRLHTAYNYHPNGNVDKRANLYYMYSYNGCDWFNRDDVKLTLPLEENSPLTKIYNSGDKYIYLKDIGMKNDTPKILYLESENFDPTLGNYMSRKLYLISPDDKPNFIGNAGHNYNTGYYHHDQYNEFVIRISFAPGGDRTRYAGGYLMQMRPLSNGRWGSTFPILKGYYNYARRVHNGNGEGFISQEINHTSGKMLKLEVYD